MKFCFEGLSMAALGHKALHLLATEVWVKGLTWQHVFQIAITSPLVPVATHVRLYNG